MRSLRQYAVSLSPTVAFACIADTVEVPTVEDEPSAPVANVAAYGPALVWPGVDGVDAAWCAPWTVGQIR
jgi:hypothetical protein